jgi:hypothetical protein
VVLISVGSAHGLDIKLLLQYEAQSGKVRLPPIGVLPNDTRIAAVIRVLQRETGLPFSIDDLQLKLKLYLNNICKLDQLK